MNSSKGKQICNVTFYNYIKFLNALELLSKISRQLKLFVLLSTRFITAIFELSSKYTVSHEDLHVAAI